MKRSLLCLAASGAALGALPAAAQTVLTTSSWVPPTHALTVAQREWCDLVEKNSGGKVCQRRPSRWNRPSNASKIR